jgi:hypothetical protein
MHRFSKLALFIVPLANGCSETPDPFDACELARSEVDVEERPVASLRMLVDGSGSMAGFLSPTLEQNQATTFEEMVYRLFVATPPQANLQSWTFGKEFVFLGGGPDARALLLTRSTYQQQGSQLQFAFNAAQLYFDSIFAPPANQSGSDSAPAAPRSKTAGADSVHVVVILSDAEQSGDGPQMHWYADFDRFIRRHVERGGQMGVVARVAERYETDTTRGTRTPQSPRPVFAFIFAGTRQSRSVRAIAERLAAPLSGRREPGESRYVIFPPSVAPEVQFRILRGVRSRGGAGSSSPDRLWIVPNGDSLRVEARLSFDSLSFAHVMARPRLVVDRCTAKGWRPVAEGGGKLNFGAPQIDSAHPATLLVPITRTAGTYSGANLYRVRVHGPAMPAWVEADFGTNSPYGVGNLERFFAGLEQIQNEPAMAAARFYVRIENP